jgi:two-component system response regulator QseB
MRLLLVEDNEPLAEAIQLGLSALGHVVDVVHSAEHALLEVGEGTFDAILLDVNLPNMSGFECLERLRQINNPTSVIILTARDTTLDKVKGLNLGADDYVVKPFELDELDARLRAISRRSSGFQDNIFEFGAVRMNIQTHEVWFDDAPVILSNKEFSVLHILIEAQGRIVSNATLEAKLYAWDNDIASNSVQVYISHLRKKMGKDFIKTHIGIGYQLNPKSSAS